MEALGQLSRADPEPSRTEKRRALFCFAVIVRILSPAGVACLQHANTDVLAHHVGENKRYVNISLAFMAHNVADIPWRLSESSSPRVTPGGSHMTLARPEFLKSPIALEPLVHIRIERT